MSHGPIFLLLLVFGYFQTGYWLARLSWKAWYEREEPGALGYLLFPVSSAWLGFGPVATGAIAPVNEFERRTYELVMANAWPLKMAWNVLALAILAAIAAVVALGMCGAAMLKTLVYGPERFIRWMTTAARSGSVRPLGGIGGILPVAVPPARPATDDASTEGGAHGIR